MTEKNDKCVILFSGGTDSCCSAFLACEKFKEVYLLTYIEKATRNSPLPNKNILALKNRFPNIKIQHYYCHIDPLLKKLSYKDYLKNLLKFHFFNLATPGLSALCWHIYTASFCIQNQIFYVYDGMTKELVHLPGHNSKIRRIFEEYYRHYQIEFSSPVIDWSVPPEKALIDQLVINLHENEISGNKTTGQYLYDKGFFSETNLKGKPADLSMQHDCYPFVVYNILYFWLLKPILKECAIEKYLISYIRSKLPIAEMAIQNVNDLNSFKENVV